MLPEYELFHSNLMFWCSFSKFLFFFSNLELIGYRDVWEALTLLSFCAKAFVHIPLLEDFCSDYRHLSEFQGLAWSCISSGSPNIYVFN